MRYMATYDLMETCRNTNQWLGATAKTLGGYPAFALMPNPMLQWMAAWGEVTERTFERMVVKPDWGIDSVPLGDGRDHVVSVDSIVERPFGDLIHFNVMGRPEMKRKIMLVAPMSGHYATLLRSTVKSLIPDGEVYVTDWHNARDIPVSEGKFDIEDYTLYLMDFMKALGPDIHVIAICQPAPLTLAATAYLAELDPSAQPKTMTLIGGPIDPSAAPTDVTDFGHRVTMGQLEETMIQRVGFKYKGVGRMVYPGLLQLASFMSMNAETHSKAFRDQIVNVAQGAASDHDRHNRFYDEYLAVMDMPAEFYLSTVERVFKEGQIASNNFVVAGHKVDIGAITNVAVKTVEGAKDDISAPGQCVAALDLLTGLPDEKKASHLEPGAGHYGIFAGKSWRDNIRPLVLDFIDSNSGEAAPAAKPTAKPTPAAAAPTVKSSVPKSAAKSKAPSKAKPAAKTAAKKPAAKKSAPKKSVTPVKTKATPAPVKAEVKPGPVKAEVKPAPVKAEVKPAPVKAEVKPAPVKAEVTPAPEKVEVKPAPVKAEVQPAPVKAEVTPAPVKAEVKPAPVKAEATPTPVKAEVKPAPATAETKDAPAKAKAPMAANASTVKQSKAPAQSKPKTTKKPRRTR